eukprot:TRINITY_DN15410_c0_g1_i1.p1 TRINITY_DN15410_c0_g1~~TRINITY_DN15410_c0_g1_i1.p1  ORF type:complete len:116 (-),score=40.30 TRINITY_DN15410_c0_g1_i1:268-582(-)
MGETESVKKLLHMGDFHSVVDCVRNRITVQHTGIVSREVERRLRDKAYAVQMMSEEAKTKSAEHTARLAEEAEQERKERKREKRSADKWMSGKMSSIDWNIVQI